MKVSEQVKQLEEKISQHETEITRLNQKISRETYQKEALLINRHGFEKKMMIGVNIDGEPNGTELIVPVHTIDADGDQFRYESQRPYGDRLYFRIERAYGKILIYREVVRN